MTRSIFFVFLSALTLSCAENELVLMENGTTQYTIIPVGEGEELDTAIDDLNASFKKVGGIEMTVGSEDEVIESPKIYVGHDAESVGSPHGVMIKTNGEDLHIMGGSTATIKYAVTEFLEKYLGYQWFAPGVEILPDGNKLSIQGQAINYRYIPEITTRTVHSRLFYEDNEFADRLKVTYESFPHYVPPARVHTFHRFMPEEIFYESNPEYYALRGERRLPTQLCLSNPEVLDIVIDSVSALFDRYPDRNVVSVSQDDNTQYCQCDKCAAVDAEEGSPAGSMIRFVNKVAERFPQKTISTLAYQYTRKPSKTPPAENVLITLCSIECDRSGPIAEKCTEFANDLEGWSALTDNIRIWDYTTQFTNFLAPFPNLRTLQPNIDLFRKNNARWIFEQHSHNPSELFELRSYLLAKLLWDPDINVDSLMTVFTDGYYEEAGSYVKKYVDRIHEEIEAVPEFFLFLYGDPSEGFNSFLDPNLLQEYSTLFDEAENAVSSKPEVLKRVKAARLGVDYAVLEACRKNLTEDYTLTSTDGKGNTVLNSNTSEKLEKFYSTCQDKNISLMNEMRFSVQDYYDNYKNTMKVAIMPNKARGKEVTTMTQPKKYAGEDPGVLTDGALGGSSFYANWLGYEGVDMEVIVDLGTIEEIKSISMAFLQVTNHIVFLPGEVHYLVSEDGTDYKVVAEIPCPDPLNKTSKVNDIRYFDAEFSPEQARFIKVVATNTPTPYWHHGAGLPSWVFADEIIVD